MTPWPVTEGLRPSSSAFSASSFCRDSISKTSAGTGKLAFELPFEEEQVRGEPAEGKDDPAGGERPPEGIPADEERGNHQPGGEDEGAGFQNGTHHTP